MMTFLKTREGRYHILSLVAFKVYYRMIVYTNFIITLTMLDVSDCRRSTALALH